MKKHAVIFIVAILSLLMSCATSQWRREKAEIHLNVASAYMGSNQYALALKELLDAEKLTPRDPKVHYLLGIVYQAKQMPENAWSELEKAIDLKHDYSDVYSFMGTIYMSQSKWDPAIESFNKALANPLYQTPAVALYNMGRAYFEKGQYREAVKKYEEARAKDPYSVPLFLIAQHTGIALYHLGETEKALVYFNHALTLAPALVEIHFWLGQSYLKLNRRADAISAFKKYLKDAPDTDLARIAKKNLAELDTYKK